MDDLDTRLDALVHRDQEQVRCPFPLFDDLRVSAPVHFNDELGAWVLTRHEDCLAVLHDPVTWSVRMRTGPRPINDVLGERIDEIAADPDTADLVAGLSRVTSRVPILSSADPPMHSKQRKLVNPTFKPGRVRAMEPTIERVAATLAQALPIGEPFDFVREFAVPLPMTIIAAMLGVPDEDLERFKTWSDDLVMPVGNQHPSRAQVEGYLRTQLEFGAFFTDVLEQRRAHPGDDLISDIATAHIDGEALSTTEQLDVISQLLSAGNETTTKLLTDMVWRLAEDQDLQAQLRADRSRIASFVEEVVRLDAPVAGLFRRATVDTEVGGQTIREGEHVWVLYAAANRDPGVFVDPAEVELDRANLKDHLGFGHGHHYCLGAGLARAEARIALRILFDRTSSMTLAPGANDFAFEDSYLLRGLRALHIQLT